MLVVHVLAGLPDPDALRHHEPDGRLVEESSLILGHELRVVGVPEKEGLLVRLHIGDEKVAPWPPTGSMSGVKTAFAKSGALERERGGGRAKYFFEPPDLIEREHSAQRPQERGGLLQIGCDRFSAPAASGPTRHRAVVLSRGFGEALENLAVLAVGAPTSPDARRAQASRSA
jgi:hypothetical protein